MNDLYQSDSDRQWRISISLNEDGTVIEEEGSAKDIYSALREAKDKLIKHLSDIQDTVVSPSERASQIQWALDKPQLH
jgi:ribosome-associated translation inhibitor RaiA